MAWLTGRYRPSSSPRDEQGFTIAEVVIALTLLAVVLVGLGVSVSSGLRLTGRSNGRQTATQHATRALELLRTVDFEVIGLPAGTVYETDPDSPDANVDTSTTPKRFTAPLEGAVVEDVVEGGTGTLEHLELIPGPRPFRLYRYVTWPTPEQDHKRVTVVVRWGGTTVGGPNQVVLSSMYSRGRIEYPPSATTPPLPTSTTVAPTTTTIPPSTTTTTPSVCPSDTSPPSISTFEIAKGTGADFNGYTASSTIGLVSSVSDSCTPLRMEFSETGTFSGSWLSYSASYLYPLSSPSDGLKTVWARYQDGAGNITSTRTAQVILDTVAPSPAPANLTASRCCGKKKADLTWDNVSADSNLAGYRIFRRDGGTGSFVEVGKVTLGGPACGAADSTCSYNDGGLNEATGYTYYVVAYDRAGNNSEKSNERSI